MDVFVEVLELVEGWVEDGTLCDLHGVGSVSLLKTNDYNTKGDLYGVMRERLERMGEERVFGKDLGYLFAWLGWC